MGNIIKFKKLQSKERGGDLPVTPSRIADTR